MSLKSGELGLHDPLLGQLLEDMKIWEPTVLGFALCYCESVLKSDNLSLELWVEQLQLFLFAKNVVVVKNYLLPLAI